MARRSALTLALVAAVWTVGVQAELATLTVTRAAAGADYLADGTVEATRQAVLSAQTSGRVVERAVEAGDTVKRGQVLVRIDDREALQVESAAQAQVAAARAQLANASAERERIQALHAQGFVSKAALDHAEAAYRTARAQVNALEASAGVSATQRSFNVVAAPYDGVVAQVQVQVGDLATPGKPLLTVYDPAAMRVLAALPQAQLNAWRREQPIRVLLPGADGSTRELTPREVTLLPVTDPASQMVTVRLELPERVEGLLPGLFAKVYFPIAERARIAVPASAVIRRGEMTAVYVVGEGERVSLRQVRLGRADGGQVEIVAGLTAGERVALDPFAAARARK